MSEVSLGAAIAHALEAYAALVDLAETIEDEWQYVTDLSTVWMARLRAVSASRGPEVADVDAALAVDAAIDEIGRISDPHRAIDWLSTFPQVVLAAFGEPG